MKAALFGAYIARPDPSQDRFDLFQQAVQHLSAAQHTPEVQALARLAGFEQLLAGFAWPIGSGGMRWPGTEAIVVPLVRSGLDTAANLELLFGPSWDPVVGHVQRETRMYVLNTPPEGSPAYMHGLNRRLQMRRRRRR